MHFPKKKNRALIVRDQWISHYIRRYKRGVITLKDYWISIVDLKREFAIEDRMV